MYEDLVIEHFHSTTRDSTYLYKIMHTRKQKYYAGSHKSGEGPNWTIRGKVFHSLAAARESLRHLLTVESVNHPEQNISDETLGIVATITRPFCFMGPGRRGPQHDNGTQQDSRRSQSSAHWDPPFAILYSIVAY